MLCTTCSKLAILYTKRYCVRCQGDVLNTISVLCDSCSTLGKVCAACLKKVDNSVKRYHGGGCGSCDYIGK